MPQRALPTVSNPVIEQQLDKVSQVALNSQISLPTTPIAPWNFKATSQRGGVLLSWSSLGPPTAGPSPVETQSNLQSADGYEIQVSSTGDFSPGKYVSIPMRDPTQTSYFHGVGGAVQTNSYRIRATNGTLGNSYAVHGLFTGVIKQASIDSSDTSTVPTAHIDTFTSDKTQSRARAWKSGTLSPF